MKKTTIASVITAGVSFCLFFASIFFIQWDMKKADATPSLIITSVFAFAIALCAFIIFAIMFDKKNKGILLVPVLAVVVFMMIFTNGVTQGANNTNTVLDYISPMSNNPTLISFLLSIAFVVSVVLYLAKGYKWAAIVSIVYITILAIVTFNYTSHIVFNGELNVYMFATLGTLVALAAILVYFLAAFVSNNEIEKKEAPAKAEEASTTEEAPAEETTEAVEADKE